MLFQHMLQQTTHDGATHVGYFNMAVFVVYGMLMHNATPTHSPHNTQDSPSHIHI